MTNDREPWWVYALLGVFVAWVLLMVYVRSGSVSVGRSEVSHEPDTLTRRTTEPL